MELTQEISVTKTLCTHHLIVYKTTAIVAITLLKLRHLDNKSDISYLYIRLYCIWQAKKELYSLITLITKSDIYGMNSNIYIFIHTYTMYIHWSLVNFWGPVHTLTLP